MGNQGRSENVWPTSVIIIPLLVLSIWGCAATKAIDSYAKTQQLSDEYIDKIELVNLEISTPPVGVKGLLIFGEIKNTGDRTLSKVEITIYLLDKSDAAIFEKNCPVLDTTWSTETDKILKPDASRKFGYHLVDMPSGWAGNWEVKITAIGFYEPVSR